MRRRGLIFSILFWITVVLTPACCLAADPGAGQPSAGQPGGEQSATDIQKKLSNPVTDLWFLQFQQNNFVTNALPGLGDKWSSNLNFQPMLPISLTRDWNLITRPVITLFNSAPVPATGIDPVTHQPSLGIQNTTAFGDTTIMSMIAPGPSLVGNWIMGAGPSFIFPTASSDFTGQGNWQLGPAVVFGYFSDKFVVGAFAQNWTSYARESGRSETNWMNLQPILSFFLPHGWSVGYSGNILADWKADGANMWTVPVGLGVSKVVFLGRLPIRLGVAGQYMPIHPDEFGQKWNVQANLTIVIPKLIKGNIFE